jgi:anti-sigma factor RsiW
MELTSQLCARARFWASLRLDGELSELEGALLDAHLARCDACSAVARDYGALTDDLRARPLERVAPVVVRHVRSTRRVFAGAAIAAVIAAGMLLGGFVRGQVSREALPAPHPVAVVASLDTPDQLRKLRRTTLLNQRRLPRDISAEPV